MCSSFSFFFLHNFTYYISHAITIFWKTLVMIVATLSLLQSYKYIGSILMVASPTQIARAWAWIMDHLIKGIQQQGKQGVFLDSTLDWCLSLSLKSLDGLFLVIKMQRCRKWFQWEQMYFLACLKEIWLNFKFYSEQSLLNTSKPM